MSSHVRRIRLSWLAVVLAAAAIVVSVASARSAAGTGQTAFANCISESGTAGACTLGTALSGVYGTAVTPDGKHVYVTAFDDDAVAVFSPNKTTGALTQLVGTDGCVSETGSGGACADGKALDNPIGIAVSPDGKYVYVASAVSNAVAVFARNKTTGALTQLNGTDGCVSHLGSGGCASATTPTLVGAWGAALSADGKNVYVTADTLDAITVFSRNASTGVLTELAGTDACVSETGTGGLCANGVALDRPIGVKVSTDGKSVYVASIDSDAVAAFSRNKTTGALTQLGSTDACVSETGSSGACTDGKALDNPIGVAISTDGKSVYVASSVSDAITAFSRSNSTGVLTQLAGTAGCVSEDGTGGECADGKALDAVQDVSITRDGKNVYSASNLANAVPAFARAKTGALTQLAGTAGCISDDGSGGDCVDGTALFGPLIVTPTSDGQYVYVTGSDAVTTLKRN